MGVSLADRIETLEYLVLSHIRATGDQASGALQHTCSMAEAYAQTFQAEGRTAAASHLRSMIRAARIQGLVPAND